MKALVYEGPGKLALQELADPKPQPGEVLLEVLAAGVCGTDHHLVAGELGVAHGTVPGHEICGRVVELGDSVAGWTVGDRAASYGQVVCGTCSACKSGYHNRCWRPEGLGMVRQGGFADLIAVPETCLVPVPDAVPNDVAAITTDAVATPFHALTRVGRLTAGESVVVIGCGGLGIHGIALARIAGAGRIVAVDPSPEARAAALVAGADIAIDPSADQAPGKAIRAAAGGAALAVEFVGRAETVELGLETLAPGGRLVVVGVGHDRPRLPPMIRFIGMEISVLGSFGSLPHEIETALDLIASGRLDMSHSVTRRVPLAEGPSIFLEPAGPGRTVLVAS